jgi:LmbE family N-acetylglucosaminyl deacetylase
MKSKERVLVVAPHCDDESFGCLGTLLKHKKNGDRLAFLWFSGARETQRSIGKVVEFFGASTWHFEKLDDQRFDMYPIVDLISPIERWVKLFQPTIVYIPFFGDLNKDHRLVSEASMVACRPCKPGAPREVRMYEIPGTTEYGLQHFNYDREEAIDGEKKYKLLKKWYPNELINGRGNVSNIERFQRWPHVNRA